MAIEQLGLLGNSFFSNIILPFVLIFTIVFSILEKTEILGKKKDIDAIVALIFGLIAVGVPAAMGVLNNLIPVIAVLIVILFVWFLVFAFVGERVKPEWSSGLKKFFAVVIGIIILGMITWATGLFDYVIIDQALAAKVGQMVLLVGAIIAVIAVVIGASEHGEEKKKED